MKYTDVKAPLVDLGRRVAALEKGLLTRRDLEDFASEIAKVVSTYVSRNVVPLHERIKALEA